MLLLVALLQVSPSPSPAPSPAPSASARPITESAEKVIDRLEAERKNPCLKAAREDVPCFPVRSEKKAYDASVRESLGMPDALEKPTPDRPPTRDEMDEHRTAPPGKPAVSVTIDPVCVGKSALKRLRGRNDTYYLYRVRDIHGERVILVDHRMDSSRFQGDIAFIGKYEGDCEAQAAYRREQRRSPGSE